MTLGDVSNIASIASTLTTGKGIPEHLISFVMGKDCRLMEGIMREDRRICEEQGAPSTAKDFKGVIVVLFGNEELNAPNPALRFATDVDPQALGTLASARTSLTRPMRRSGAQPVRDPRFDGTLTLAAAVRTGETAAPALSRTQARRPASLVLADAKTLTGGALDDAALGTVTADLRPSLVRTAGRRAAQAPRPVLAVASPDDSFTLLATESVLAKPQREATETVYPGDLAATGTPALDALPGRKPSIAYSPERTSVRIRLNPGG